MIYKKRSESKSTRSINIRYDLEGYLTLEIRSFRGQFAVVRKCVEQKSGCVYAAKIMRKRRVVRGVGAADIGKIFFSLTFYVLCETYFNTFFYVLSL